jgi:type I restriction enzyme, S subunit
MVCLFPHGQHGCFVVEPIKGGEMKGWEEFKLDDVIKIKHGYAFKGEFFSEEPTDNILLTPGNFAIGGGFKADKLKFYSGDVPEDYILNKGDVIVTMTDLSKAADTLGFSARVPYFTNKKLLHNQRIGLVELKNQNVDLDFIYWLMRKETYQRYVAGSATGATVKHTSPSKICSYKFKAPKEIATQRRIASILSAYDDLIENNLKRIKLLEELAQRTYEEWFVRLKFPGHENKPVNEETGLPAGWERKKIGDSCIISGGGTPSRKINEYWENGVHNWYSPTDLTKASSIYVEFSTEKITDLGLTKSSAKLLSSDSFMMSSRATIGLFAITDSDFSTNQGFINITPFKSYQKEYLLYNFKTRIEEFIGFATGATFPELSKSKFKVLGIIWPDEKLIQGFHSFASLVHDKIIRLTKQNRLLKESRDILLPRLMGGAIGVEEAEGQMSMAAEPGLKYKNN